MLDRPAKARMLNPRLIAERTMAFARGADHLEEQTSPTDKSADLSSVAGPTATNIGDPLRDLVWRQSCGVFSWTKTDGVTRIARRRGDPIEKPILDQSSIVEATNSGIGFMSLPLELREMVYDLALISDETDERKDSRNRSYCSHYRQNLYKRPVICLQRCSARLGHDTCYYGWKSEWAQQPALTRVSREVRAETLPIYYAKNEFVVFATGTKSWPGSFRVVKRFLGSIGQHNARLIKHLSLLFTMGQWYDIDGEDVRAELAGECMGLARAAVQLFEASTTFSNPVNPDGFEAFGWGFRGEERGSDPEVPRSVFHRRRLQST